MKKHLFLLALIIVVGAILWFVLNDEPPMSEPIPSPESQLSAPGPEESPEPIPRKSAVAQSTQEEAAGIRGRVAALETGRGVEGATVKATLWVEEELHEVEAITDAEGNFAVTSRGPGKYRVRVLHADLVSEEPRYTATVHEGEATPELVVWMMSGGVVSGRVYDSLTGEGIAGVRVGANRALFPGVTTDVDGRYRLGGLPAGKRRIVLGHAKGYIDPPDNSYGVRVPVSPGTELPNVDFPLQPGVFAAITGKVVDEQGKPVAGAEVTAGRDELARDPVWGTDDSKTDGSFQVDELQVASDYYVTAKSEGLISEELGPLGLTDEGIHDLVLTLRPLGSISGQVVDVNTGKPVAEPEFVVDTSYVMRGRKWKGGRSSFLDENGNFEIVNLPPGLYRLFINTSGHSFGSGMVVPQVTINLEHGQRIADVCLTFDYERYPESKEVRTEPAQRAEPARPKVGEVRGQVLSAKTNETVATFHLVTFHEYYAGGHHSSRTVHDPEGRFIIDEDQGETLTIAITAKGYAPTREEVQGGLGEQPEHDITVRLQPGGLVDGEVMDTSGNAVGGAAVYVGLDPSTMDSSDHRGRTPHAVTGPDGSFRLDSLPGTATTIYVSHPSFAVWSGEVRAGGGVPARLRIVLSVGGAIEGIVRRSGQPLAKQWIGVLNESGVTVRFSGDRTDSQGRFRLEDVTPGLYTLYTGIEEGSRSIHLDAEVAEGMVTQVDFDFD